MFIPETKIAKWMAFVAALTTLVYLLRDYLSLPPDRVTQVTVAVLLCLFIFGGIARELSIGRKEKYANINQHTHRMHHIMRDLNSFLVERGNRLIHGKAIDYEGSKKIADKAFTDILDEFVALFSLLTGTECRACIKTVLKRDGKLLVYSFARDSKSRDANFKRDKDRLAQGIDTIEKNVDFQLLYDDFGPQQRFFFSNDLTRRRGYRSSSFEVYGEPPEDLGIIERLKGVFHMDMWPLPYKSAVVWPIQLMESPDFHFDVIGCIGFLSIDSVSRNVFSKRWDFPVGAGVADALFYPLKNYKNLSALYDNIQGTQGLYGEGEVVAVDQEPPLSTQDSHG